MSSLMINSGSDGGHLISSLSPVGLISEWALTIDIYVSNSDCQLRFVSTVHGSKKRVPFIHQSEVFQVVDQIPGILATTQELVKM